MLSVPAIGERSGRTVIGVLLLVKLLLLVWNAYAYDGRSYDAGHHADRAVFAGLKPSALAYDPPLYYLPLKLASWPEGAPRIERHAVLDDDDDAPRPKRQSRAERAGRAHLLTLLRYGNVAWMSIFYLGWIGYAFPRLLGRGSSWFLASLMLLALPGYQKVAAMSHPENLLAALSTLSVCSWLALKGKVEQESTAAEEPSPRPRAARPVWLAVFALTVALLGMTRPTALVPVAVFTLLGVVYVRRSYGPAFRSWAPRAALLVTLVATLSGSWYLLRYQRTSALTAFMAEGVAEAARARRPSFDYASYFISFQPRKLLTDPNTTMGDPPPPEHGPPRADSFFTLLYSEVWGDHWLSFSGPKGREGKAWPKRMALGAGLLLPAVLALLTAAGVSRFASQLKSAWRESSGALASRLALTAKRLEVDLVLLAWSALGALLFVAWQAGPALLPGEQHSIKFIHIASLVPAAIALLFRTKLDRSTATLLASYLLVTFLAAFPVAMYFPG